MNDRIPTLLRRRIKRQIGVRVLVGSLNLVAGVVGSYVTFWVIYGVTWFVLRRFGIDFAMLSATSGVVLLLIFIGNARTSREYLEEYSVSTGTISDKVVTFYVPGMGMLSNVNPLAPDTLHTGIKLITTVLYIGPRLVTAATRAFLKAGRLASLDKADCVAITAFLYARGERAAFEDIAAALPEVDPAKSFPKMAEVDGILVLHNDPPGLALSTRLREELGGTNN